MFFADVKGSVHLEWSIDPEVWRRVMEQFYNLLCDGIGEFGGTLDKFTGDGIMAVFGAPIAHEDHAQRACHAALHLIGRLNAYSAELAASHGIDFAVRMGINSGEVVVGAIGSEERLTYTAIGKTVGLARRMEQYAEPGTAYVSQSTAALVAGYFELKSVGDVAVKGWPAPVRVFELGGVNDNRTPLGVASARGLSRFVGRDDEINLLDATLTRAAAGRGQTIGIGAGGGVGKSRLVHEFAERCRQRGITVHAAHAPAHSRAQPLLPVLAILRSFLSAEPGDDDEDPAATVRRQLLALNPSLEPELPLLFDFLGLHPDSEPAPRLDPEIRERHLVALLRQLVLSVSAREPTILVIEDVHWLDRASRPFVRAIADVVRDTRTLLLVTFRTDYRPDWLFEGDYQQLHLRLLAPEATDELLTHLLGGDPSMDGLVDIIRERTAGNPFFIEELVRSLVEAGNIGGKRGAHRLERAVDELAVPATVQAVLTARIDRLPDDAQAVLRTAAVIGRRFTPRLISRVMGSSEASLLDALRALVDSAFLSEAAEREVLYDFQHPLTREVAYTAQLGDQRAAVHAEVGRALAELEPDRRDERASLIAFHWDMAGEPREAAEWHARAAAWASTRNRTEALEHWSKVRSLLACLPESPDTVELAQRARIWSLELGWRVGITEAVADEVFAEGREVAERTGDLASLANLLTPYAFLQGQAGRLERYIELSSAAVRAGDGCDDVRARLNAYASLTHALYLAGRLEDGLRTAERAIQVTAGDPAIEGGLGDVISALAHFTRFRGAFLLHLGHLSEALQVLDEAVTIAAGQDDLEILAWAHATYSGLESYVGEARQGTKQAEEAVRIAERIGGAFLVWAYEGLGLAHLLEGRDAEAIAAFRRSLDIARDSGSGLELASSTLAHLADALCSSGQIDGALAAAREAVELASRGHLRLYEISALRAHARALIARAGPGDRRIAAQQLKRALELALEIRARAIEPILRLDLLQARRHRASERAAVVRQAEELFRSNGAHGHLARLDTAPAAAMLADETAS